MKQKKILISNGPTRAYIDPIRYITNGSTGYMGLSLVKQAIRLGYKIVVVSGPIKYTYPKGVKVINVLTAEDMYKNLNKYFSWTDVFISAAAVVDFKVKTQFKNKIKKDSVKGNFVLKLVPNVDILKKLSLKKRKNQIIMGFALETNNLINNAKQKLKNKNLDFIIANSSIGMKDIKGYIISKDKIVKFSKMNKSIFAKKIINKILSKGD